MDGQGNVTALAVQPAPKSIASLSTGAVLAIVPQTFDEVYRFAQIVAASGLAPATMRQPEQIAVAILTGLEMGVKPMQAINGIAVINGRPSIWGDLQLALVRASGELESFSETFEGDEPEDWANVSGPARKFKAVCKLKRRGQPDTVLSEFSIADAIQAGLWKKSGPWTTNPKRMMRMRARSFALRDTFADSLRGMASAEEMQDVERRDDIQDVPSRIIPPKPPVPPAPEPPVIEHKQPQAATVEEQAPTPSQTRTPASEAPDVFDGHVTVSSGEAAPKQFTKADLARDIDPDEFLADFAVALSGEDTEDGVREVGEFMDAGKELEAYPAALDHAREIFAEHLKRVRPKPEATVAPGSARKGEPLDYAAKPMTGDDYYAFAQAVAANPPPEGALKWWNAGEALRATLHPTLGFKRLRELTVLFGATKAAK